MTRATEPIVPRKPRFALAIATAGGLGYLKPAPGTWGSLGGFILALGPWIFWAVGVHLDLVRGFGLAKSGSSAFDPLLLCQATLTLGLAAVGVIAASRAASYLRQVDPSVVVIDEVSGQHLTYLLGGLAPSFSISLHRGIDSRMHPLSTFQAVAAPNWKFFFLGFILFRVFDIWKPFPARQAEKLPGGWGIMADDWLAAIYAAFGLWIARAMGL